MSVEPVELSAKQHRAALLAAEDELTNIEIAAVCGISDRTLDRWKKLPEFGAAVKSHIEALSRDLSRYAIARKDKRLAALQSRHSGYQQVIAARGEALAGECAGGETGLVSKEFELDRDGIEHEVYKVDTGTSAEMRALEKQAAIEVGEWSEKRDITTTGAVKVTLKIDRRDAPGD